jgi:hypothetical protein
VGVTAGPKLPEVTVTFCICGSQNHLNSTDSPITNHLAGLPLYQGDDADILPDRRNKPYLGCDTQVLPS